MDWRERIPAEDRRVYETAGYGGEQPFGQRPALLVIDVTRGFVGSPGLSRQEAAREYRNSCGPAAWAALPVIQQILEAVREAAVPVVYTHGRSAETRDDLGGWAVKNRRAGEDVRRGDEVNRIVDEVAPQPGELVLAKEKPSAFLGTPLLSHLIGWGVDSIVVVGCTTSGCVRGTVVDAFSYNYAVTVVEDGVFDRGELPHAANLFDMESKYAAVRPASEVGRLLRA